MSLEETLRAGAREQGTLSGFRVSVLEQDLRTTHKDFALLDDAIAYANDCVSETGDEQAIAYVFDASFVTVHRGKPYWG